MPAWVWFVFVAIVGCYVYGAYRKETRRDSIAGRLTTILGFYPDQVFVDERDLAALAINAKSQRIGLVHERDNQLVTRVYSFREVVSAELMENEASVSKTSRGGQAGGGLAGGLLLGPLGAAVGGLSAKKTPVTHLTMLAVRVVFEDMADPSALVRFYQGPPIEVGTREADEALARARACLDALNVAIRKGESELA